LVCLVFLLSVVLCICHGEEPPASGAGPAGAGTPWNRGLRILCAGRPGSDREKDFVGFLRKYFDVVQTGNLETLKESDMQGCDVTLLDWDCGEIRGPRLVVSESFSRPVITLGVPGGMICRQWRLKTGYL
jgi:hypothetical protein